MKNWARVALAIGAAGAMVKGCEMYEDSVADEAHRENDAKTQKLEQERESMRRKEEGWGKCVNLFKIKFGRALVPLDVNDPDFTNKLNLRIELEHPFVTDCHNYYQKTGELPQN